MKADSDRGSIGGSHRVKPTQDEWDRTLRGLGVPVGGNTGDGEETKAKKAMSIRILLADDHKVLREGLRALLQRAEDMEIVAEAGDGRSTVALARELSPDLVVMDIGMGNVNGIDATREIAAICPGVKILALSMHGDEQFVTGMFAAGASGYLIKDCAAEELSLAIRTIVAGGTYLSPPISRVLVKEYVGRPSRGDLWASSVLTGKEREILQLLAEGKTSRQIASCLGMNVRTIEGHRRGIMRKLDIHTTAELTKYALRMGITSLEW
jgi:two-component system response regulator NreC